MWVALVSRNRHLPTGRPPSAPPAGVTLRTCRHAGGRVQFRVGLGRTAAVVLEVQHGDRLLVEVGFNEHSGLLRLSKSDLGYVVTQRSLSARHLEVGVYAARWGLPEAEPGLFAHLHDWYRVRPRVIVASLPRWAVPERRDDAVAIAS